MILESPRTSIRMILKQTDGDDAADKNAAAIET
jgi:hypothetical protein